MPTQVVKTSWGASLTITSEEDLSTDALQAEYDQIKNGDRSEQSVRHRWAAVYTEIGRRQSYIDSLARDAGLRPPHGPVEGCSACESNGKYGPSHWASSRCQSGGHVHCTCDTCF